jgi:putative CocE/NonD family hydrolase
LNNFDAREWAPAAPYRNSRIADTGYMWTDFGPSDWPVRLSESGIAIYHVGAWFDLFTLGTTQWYATLKATNPSKMLIHPSLHCSLDLPSIFFGPYWRYFGEDMERAAKGILKERLRFFDRYLKGIKNGIDTEPAVFIYVMNGKGWRFEKEWPLARQIMIKYYFEGGNTLSKIKGTNGFDKYKADFSHDSRYGPNKATRWNVSDLRDEPMKRTDKDQKCLTYTSKPLERDTEVTGHPIIRFWVSSTADNGDFFVYLEDVDEKGEAYYVTEGKLRAGFAGLVPQEEMLATNAHIKVLPNLPYHGFKDNDYVEKIFTGGKIVELVIDLYPTSWVFKKGHRIRVSIACADWPTFDLHPKLSPKNVANDPANTVPTITVYHDTKHPSRIEFPVIPPKSKGALK